MNHVSILFNVVGLTGYESKIFGKIYLHIFPFPGKIFCFIPKKNKQISLPHNPFIMIS